jgi:NAD-dependent deacetylase
MVQIHGDIFITRCLRCDLQTYDHKQEQDENSGLPKCPHCNVLMRPGVVWFGEQLDPAKISTVEKFISRGDCNVVMVAGTTALFGYIIDWALRGRGKAGRLIEINPEETSLSQFSAQSFREPAGVALPRLVTQLLANLPA